MSFLQNDQEVSLLFRKANHADTDSIWQILQDAIAQRKLDGSQQWQDGYPNLETVNKDIKNGWGFVLVSNDVIIAYAALIENDEPAYQHIDGAWLSNGDFLVIHRVAVSRKVAGKGIATQLIKEIESYARTKNIPSIKVDTNFDNPAMLKILQNLHYSFCGEVQLRGAPRKAFEKLLN